MGANPNANGGLLLEELKTPDFKKYGIKGASIAYSFFYLGGIYVGIYYKTLITNGNDSNKWTLLNLIKLTKCKSKRYYAYSFLY